MSTLLLRLAGPLQSWGIDSKFETRRTLGFPTKSGMVGLLAAALGRSREESLEDLNHLKFGIRVDKEGEIIKDYQIARKKSKNEHVTYVIERYYLSDSIFLAGFESDDDTFLEKLESALKSPVFPLFLGRRSCPPTQPLLLGIRNKNLIESLKSEPWLLEEWRQKRIHDDSQYPLRIIIDDTSSTMSVLKDKAISFNPQHRQFSWRAVKEEYVNIKMISTEHDPILELR